MAIESNINAQVVTILQALTGVGEVSNYEKSQFRKYPAITVVGSENESDFEGNSQRHRIYGLRIRLYVETSSDRQSPTGEGLKESDRILRNLSDTAIDAFDKPANARFSGSADSVAEKVLFVEPTPSQWFYDTERGLRGKEINLRVHTFVNTAAL